MLGLFTFLEMDILKCFGLNVILLFSISVSGQNLVLNPSFEEHTDCPTLDINVGTYTGMDIVVDLVYAYFLYGLFSRLWG